VIVPWSNQVTAMTGDQVRYVDPIPYRRIQFFFAFRSKNHRSLSNAKSNIQF